MIYMTLEGMIFMSDILFSAFNWNQKQIFYPIGIRVLQIDIRALVLWTWTYTNVYLNLNQVWDF